MKNLVKSIVGWISFSLAPPSGPIVRRDSRTRKVLKWNAGDRLGDKDVSDMIYFILFIMSLKFATHCGFYCGPRFGDSIFFRNGHPPRPPMVSGRIWKLICLRVRGLRKLENSEYLYFSCWILRAVAELIMLYPDARILNYARATANNLISLKEDRKNVKPVRNLHILFFYILLFFFWHRPIHSYKLNRLKRHILCWCPAMKGFLPGPVLVGESQLWCPAMKGFSPGPALLAGLVYGAQLWSASYLV